MSNDRKVADVVHSVISLLIFGKGSENGSVPWRKAARHCERWKPRVSKKRLCALIGAMIEKLRMWFMSVVSLPYFATVRYLNNE
jgi:hypothetical protein